MKLTFKQVVQKINQQVLAELIEEVLNDPENEEVIARVRAKVAILEKTVNTYKNELEKAHKEQDDALINEAVSKLSI